MKNFTKQNFKTNPLWIRLLIMTFMLLAGAGNVWGYWVTGGAFAGWGNWTELTYESDSRYVVAIQNINSEFKLSTTNNYNSCWNDLGTSDSNVSLKINNDNNHKILGGSVDILCFDPTGYDGKGAVWTEKCAILKHPWDGGSNWYWKVLKKNSDGTFSITAIYRGGGLDYRYENMSSYVGSPTKVNNPQSGDECVFTFNPSNKTITITKVVTCDNNPDFSVSLSKSEVAVGCTDVTASITGDDSQTVTCTWSSTDPSVATINSSTGDITIKAAGTTTIKATTTEDGGFCGGVEKPATLTVKSPSVKVSANENSLCERETLTLTATLTNCGTGNSIQWYKEANPIAGETSATLTINSVTTANSGSYKAVVSGGILCSNVESTPITITVNALPSAPGLKTASSITVCPGNLTLANYVNVTAGTTVKWYSNEDCTNEATSPSITAGERKIFYAKAVNSTTGCVSSGKTTLTITAYSAPNDFTLTAIPTEICSGADVVISIGNKQDGVTYKLGNETISESITVNPTDDTEYTVTASLNACPALTKSISTEIITVHPIPSFTVDPTNLSLCKGSTSETDLTELSHVEVANGNPVWYDAETAGNVVTTGADLVNGGTYWVAAENAEKGCVNQQRKSFTLTIHDLPASPTLNNTSEAVCQADKTVNLNTLAGVSGVNWYDSNSEPVTNGNVSITTAGTYTFTAKAVNGNGCQSATGAEFELTVNPRPTITAISVNNSTPVINEDVLLTVEGGDIARVEWSITSGNNASLSDASDYSVKLTSTTSGAVTVTATATSANGCTASTTKSVTFSAAENCDPITDNTKIEIWCQVTGTTTPYCHAYNIKSPNNVGFANWPGLTHTSKSGDYYIWTLDNTNGLDISNNKVGIVFSKNSDGKNQTADITTFYVGNRYYFTYNANSNDKNTNYTQGNSEPLTTPVPLSAPAVKTVSVNSEQGSGVVNFTGQIIKTGCAATSSIYYGYQFKKVDEVWPTSGTQASNTPVKGKLIPLTNASETALYYQFSANVENLEDGDYHFRAYIINGYNFTNGNYDQGVYYGLDKLVTVSTVQTAVKTAEIKPVNQDGTPVELGHKYCVGATAYIEVTSDVKYTTATWKSDLGVEVEQIGKTNIYQFEVKGKDQIVVLLSNKHNTEPVSSAPLEVDVYASPSIPEIALGASSICDTNEDGTTLTVTRTKAGQYYALYKEDGNGGTLVKDYQLCSTDNAEIEFTGLKEAAKYFVKTYTSECPSAISVTSSATLTVVDSKDLKISIEPITTETTPWMPAKLTVEASGDYTITSTPNDAVINKISNNTYKVKLPLPASANKGEDNTVNNVTFSDVDYVVEATLISVTGEAQECVESAKSTITLKQYIEPCTQK